MTKNLTRHVAAKIGYNKLTSAEHRISNVGAAAHTVGHHTPDIGFTARERGVDTAFPPVNSQVLRELGVGVAAVYLSRSPDGITQAPPTPNFTEGAVTSPQSLTAQYPQQLIQGELQ